MLDNITKSNLFNSIENIKGIGPKTSKLFEKLCGTKIIALLLTMPRGIKKRMFLDQVSEQFLKEEVALIITVVKHIPQFNPRMPYKILCKNVQND